VFPQYDYLTSLTLARSNGAKVDIRLRIDEPASDLSVVSGVFGEGEYWFDGLSQVERILDLGSNIGCTALWFSLLAHHPIIACVEADPRNVPILIENLQRNQVKHRVFHCAVAAAPGIAEFSFGAHTACGTLANTGMHGHAKKTSVPLKTIPALLDEMAWDEVDLVKMDIEGTELELFQTGGAWLQRVKRIVMEIHPNTSPEEIHSLARPYGFDIQRIGYKTEPTFLLSRNS
jgi:FkbM family methyltransferase